MLIVLSAMCMGSVLAFNDSVNLIELDKRLTHLLLHPASGKGAVLLKDGYFLYSNLDDVADMIESKNPKGTRVYNEILSAGGIQFHKANYNPDMVRDTLQYNPDDYEMLQSTVGGIENTVRNIETMLNETALAEAGQQTSNPITQW